ncbi:A1 cistron-splicing factor [Xylaria nigripes]|nr:A1 cistron-splicing factor [Xylaria nigripes]
MEHSSSKSTFLSRGDVFILDGLSPNSTIGCDTTSLNSEPPFPGFRDIPPGVHLIWVSPSESTSSRSGYWICTPQKDDSQLGHVYVKQWDQFNEVLGDPTGEAELQFQQQKLEQIVEHLLPYHLGATGAESSQRPPALSDENESPSDLLDESNIWYQLTFAIHPKLLSRITGLEKDTWLVATTDGVAGDASLTEEAHLYAQGMSQLRFAFTVGARLINPEATGAERTLQALDPTKWIIDKLEDPSGDYGLEDLLGEFQFAFIVGTHLGNLSCLEQWFFLAAQLIFRSFNLTVQRPQLARSLIQTFHAQLLYNNRYLQGDIFELIPGKIRKLKLALTTYKARLDEKLSELGDLCTPDQQSVSIAFSSLESWLLRLGWDLKGDYVRSGNLMLEDGEIVEAELSDFEDEDERGEFAPTIVEMENGREAGLLSWD